MKLRILLTISASLAVMFFLNACRSKDFYHDRAVQRARKFILEEDKTLTLEQQEFIKYNKPVIMAAEIFSKLATGSSRSHTLSHVCIAWIVPGHKDAYVVFGTSDNYLRDWYPNRVIIKRYDQPAHKFHAANRAAVLYAVNNFLYLSNKQLNRVRFSPPETIVTDYKITKEALEGKGIKPKNLKSLMQVTFVWPSYKEGHKIFVCGLGYKKLGGWKPIFGGETPTSELKQHFVADLSFGQFAPEDIRSKKTEKVLKSKTAVKKK